jgi:hypothetical protein
VFGNNDVEPPAIHPPPAIPARNGGAGTTTDSRSKNGKVGGGFFTVPNGFVRFARHQHLSATERDVWLALRCHGWGADRICTWTPPMIAAEYGIAIRNVERAMSSLASKGAIVTVRQGARGRAAERVAIVPNAPAQNDGATGNDSPAQNDEAFSANAPAQNDGESVNSPAHDDAMPRRPVSECPGAARSNAPAPGAGPSILSSKTSSNNINTGGTVDGGAESVAALLQAEEIWPSVAEELAAAYPHLTPRLVRYFVAQMNHRVRDRGAALRARIEREAAHHAQLDAKAAAGERAPAAVGLVQEERATPAHTSASNALSEAKRALAAIFDRENLFQVHALATIAADRGMTTAEAETLVERTRVCGLRGAVLISNWLRQQIESGTWREVDASAEPAEAVA